MIRVIIIEDRWCSVLVFWAKLLFPFPMFIIIYIYNNQMKLAGLKSP